MLVAILAAAAACQPVRIEGTAVIGFEASYVVPVRGDLRRRKIWVQNANLLASRLDRAGVPRRVWRRGPVKVSGCMAKGRFGHLGGYRYQLSNMTFVD